MPSDLLIANTRHGSDLVDFVVGRQLHALPQDNNNDVTILTKPHAFIHPHNEDLARFRALIAKVHFELTTATIIEEEEEVQATTLITPPPPPTNCPHNHGLLEFSTPTTGFACDHCGQNQCLESVMFGCRICNFDLCTNASCSGDLCLTSVKQQRCPRMHGMVETRWDMERFCDDCGKVQRTRSRVLACVLCDYDLCVTCAGLHVPSWYEVLGFDCTTEPSDLEIKQRAFELSLQYRKQCVRNPNNQVAQIEALAKYEEVTQALVVLTEHRYEYDQVLASPGGAKNWTRARDYVEEDFFHRVLSPPSFGRHRRRSSSTDCSEPSVAHGLYVATFGVLWAPVACTGYGAMKLGLCLAESAHVVATSCVDGASLVASGVHELSTGEAPKPSKRSSKIHVADASSRRWQRNVRNAKAKPWARVRTGAMEPLVGVAKGALIVTVASVGSVLGIVGGSCHGIVKNVQTGAEEVRAARAASRS